MSVLIALRLELNALQHLIETFDVSFYVTEELFNDSVNKNHNEVRILGAHFEPARVLKEVDPLMYGESYNRWVNSHNKEDFSEYKDLVERETSLREQIEEVEEVLGE